MLTQLLLQWPKSSGYKAKDLVCVCAVYAILFWLESNDRQSNIRRVCVYEYRRRQWHPNPVLLPGKSHGRRSLVGCSPWGRWGSDMTERLHFHFSLSCIGEGKGNPLQCSCLENPRDGGAWWAAVYGVTESRTWLKRLSSSSSSVWIYKGIYIETIHMELEYGSKEHIQHGGAKLLQDR